LNSVERTARTFSRMPTVYTSDEFMQALHYTLYMTVQHGSADTVVRL